MTMIRDERFVGIQRGDQDAPIKPQNGTLESDLVEVLSHDLAIEKNITASLRRDLEQERADNARWAARNKVLELRLARIQRIASGGDIGATP